MTAQALHTHSAARQWSHLVAEVADFMADTLLSGKRPELRILRLEISVELMPEALSLDCRSPPSDLLRLAHWLAGNGIRLHLSAPAEAMPLHFVRLCDS